GDNDANLVLVHVEHVHHADKAGEGAVVDFHIVAHVVVDHDLVLFHAQLGNLLLGEGGGFGTGAHEAGGAADVLDDVPGLVGHDHLHQHIAGEHLAVIGFRTLVGDFGDGFHGNGDNVNEIFEMPRFHRFFNGGLDGILVAGVCVNHIPFCCFCRGGLSP